ncbi:MAG: septum formation initiator family protein [Alphaproteobacteria bacterium]|nr:septum formation initiator family protein [Alphaproteobacteria bacterium]
MDILWELQNKLKAYGIWIIILGVLTYFVFFTINGDRSLFKYFYLKQEIATAKKSAAEYQKQKRSLEEKVKHLSNSSLDLDLLEERVRIVLNMAADDEFVLLNED